MLKKEPEVKKMSLLQVRAWLREEKLMSDVEYINFAPETVVLTDTMDCFNIADVELMQSTGLKDKNGVEIFEGDILLHTSKSVNYSDTYWHSYVQAYRMDNGAYRIKGAHIYDTELMGARNHLEVVGNIYEHADLLKKDRFMTED